MSSILVEDVLGLPSVANSIVASVVLDPRTLLTHTEFSTETDVSRSETFRLTDAGDGTAGSGVWVGPRPFDYQVEAILPALKLRGVSLAVLVFNPRDSESWRSQISMATSDLAKRLGLSVVILCSEDSPGAIASEAAELLQQNKARQASAIVRLSSLATGSAPVTPDLVGQELVDAVGTPVAVVGREEVIIWRSQSPPPSHGHRLSAPIGPGVARIDAYLRQPSDSRTAFVLSLLSIGGLLLTQWYYDQREATFQTQHARTSLLSELAAVKGRIPGTLISLASSVGWPLDGWHIVISTRHRPDRGHAMEDGIIVASALDARGFRARAAQHHDHWVLCCTQDRQPTAEEYSGLVQALEESFSSRTDAAVFGVSRARTGPNGFVKSLAEAEDLARRGGRGRVRRTRVNSRESEASQLVRSTVSDPMLLNPAEALLAALVRPENEYLLHTLWAYLDLESNLSATSRRLGVHRNTVISRIARVEEILNASLDEPDLRLALRIAIRTLSESVG